MPQLANAPLKYMLGMVHFTTLPELHRFVDKLLDAVRDEYPLREEFQTSNLQVTFGPEGLKVADKPEKHFQFSSPDRKWAFAFSPTNFALHTIDYRDHGNFIERFRWGLERLLDVEGVDIRWWTGAGIRYVNWIQPSDGKQVSDYLTNGVLPAPLHLNDPEARLEEGVYFSKYKTKEGDLRFTVSRNPPSVLPPGVQSPLTDRNGWTFLLPKGDFAVVDIDHAMMWETPINMSTDDVCQKLLALRESARAAFDRMGTAHAWKEWGSK